MASLYMPARELPGKTLVNQGLDVEAMRNLIAAWPGISKVRVAEQWSDMIDMTRASMPVIRPVRRSPNLLLATGYSGRGFGTAPEAGAPVADLIMGTTPIGAGRAHRQARTRSASQRLTQDGSELTDPAITHCRPRLLEQVGTRMCRAAGDGRD
ncbi:MAG: FAD-dependent oxidoreductase [Novosphingobium sp.]